jgi:hypothetical protein
VPDLGFAPARRAVVVLVDGLGYAQLARRAGHAPFLRAHLPSALRLDCGFPSTTAASMGTFGTATSPGTHGLVGFEVLDPSADEVFNQLSWENGPDPFAWQPVPTVFELLATEDVLVTRIGPRFFEGSGLTNAALRGGRFVAAASPADRVHAAVTAVRAAPRSLAYLYWGEVDKAGHVHGADSWEVVDQLETVDRSLATLAASVPDDTALYVTADHGMVDVPFGNRVDLAHEPELLDGVHRAGGEPRGSQLYTRPGAAADVAARWHERLGDTAWVTTRDEMVAAGWFGEVRPEVLPRIGDVLALMLTDVAVVDSTRMRPELVRLFGHHGSITEEERGIPLVSVPARTA